MTSYLPWKGCHQEHLLQLLTCMKSYLCCHEGGRIFPHYHCQQLQSHATFKDASESDISKVKESCFVCIPYFPGVQWGMLYGTFILVLIAYVREGGKHLNKAIIEEESKLMLQQHHLLHIAWRHLPRKKVRHKEFINFKSKGSLPFSFCYLLF